MEVKESKRSRFDSDDTTSTLKIYIYQQAYSAVLCPCVFLNGVNIKQRHSGPLHPGCIGWFHCFKKRACDSTIRGSRTKGFLRAAAKARAVDVDNRAANLVKTPRSKKKKKKANTLSIVCGVISRSASHRRDPIVLFSPHLSFRPRSLVKINMKKKRMMEKQQQQQQHKEKAPEVAHMAPGDTNTEPRRTTV